MILVVGLGNPGKEYSHSKHNLGFMVVDELATRMGVTLNKKGFAGQYGEAVLEGKKVILLKPQTYMNRSGQSVSEMADFFKITPGNIIVVYDEMDLPLGNLRIKLGGGSAGHKGIESIINRLGDDDFVRVRVGIGKPVQKTEAVGHVLSHFRTVEKNIIKEAVNRATDAIMEIIINGVESAMNKFNRRPENPELIEQANSK